MLKPPTSWRDELSEALEPAAFAPAPQRQLRLPLTYRASLPDKLAESGVTLQEVATDVAAGFTGEWRQGKSGDQYYRLSSSRFDLFMTQMEERDSGAPLALVTSVKPARRLARREGAATAEVSFHLAYEAESCTIADVHQVAGDLPDRARIRDDARRRAGRALAATRIQEHELSALHSDIRRHYSALLLMLTLLRQRGEVEGGATAEGVALDPAEIGAAGGDGLLCVAVGRQKGEFPDAVPVQVTVPGRDRPWRLELVSSADDVFFIEPPQSGEIAPGTAVGLSYEPRFALKRHEQALKQFLDEQVEGDWASLARLLAAPAMLTLPGRRGPLTAYNAQLNAEQRDAVSGAVASPHAFFVQGPPGTGKTTVITETVRQLVARGERVLLLAPMHVAVDEVLRRVGDADGVLALRISWDDSKVREDLRRFTPDNVAGEFIQRARRPATSKANEWRAEAQRLESEREPIQRFIAARQALAHAESRHQLAERERAAWQAGHRGDRLRLDAEFAGAQEMLAAIEGRLAAARAAEQAAAAAVTTARQRRSFGERLAGLFGSGEVAQLERAQQNADMERDTIEAERAAGADRLAAVAASRNAFAVQEATTGPRHERANAEAARGAEAARQVAAARTTELRQVFVATDLTRLTDADLVGLADQRRVRADRLGQYIRLEQRWFQITGLGNAPSDADQRRLITDLSQDLLQAANLVCCTTTGFGGDPLVRDSDYDTLIVDEASRVVDSEFLIGAKQARRWILVGDEHQLPPYVDSADEHHLHALAALHMTDREVARDEVSAVAHLGELWREDEELHRFRTDAVERTAARLRESGLWEQAFKAPFSAAHARLRQLGDDAERELLAAMRQHLVRSLFERCVEACPAALRQPLIEQRRMIDPIARLVREPIYKGRYRSPSESELRKCGVTPLVGGLFTQPLVFLDTSSQPRADEELRGTGFANALEAEWIATACRSWERELNRLGVERITVSVLAFYRAQAREIRKALGHPSYRGFRVLSFEVVDSIDRIQGQESDLVLISFCRTHRGRPSSAFGLWLQDRRRLNVACTRARRSLILVGHRRTLEGLRGIPAAEAFYRNLFGVFDSGKDTLVMKDLR